MVQVSKLSHGHKRSFPLRKTLTRLALMFSQTDPVHYIELRKHCWDVAGRPLSIDAYTVYKYMKVVHLRETGYLCYTSGLKKLTLHLRNVFLSLLDVFQ